MEATSKNSTFDFLTIDDVLEQNAKCKEENKRLHDIIDDSITDLYDGLKRVNNRVDVVELDIEDIDEKGTVKSTYKQSVKIVNFKLTNWLFFQLAQLYLG